MIFKVHVHRMALRDPEQPRKWYVHYEDWPEVRTYVDVLINVPSRTVVSPERGCGCAVAWMEGEATPDQMHDDGSTLIIGP